MNLAVTWIVQLLMVPLLLHHLGRDTFGLYAALTSVVGYFGLLTFGSALTVPRYVADHAARGDSGALGEFFSTYFALHLAIGAVGLLIGVGVAPLLEARLVVPDALRGAVAPAWRLVVAAWALGLAAGLFQSLLTGLGEVHLANLANAVRTAFNLAVAAAVVWSGGDLQHLLLGFLGAGLVASAALYLLIRSRHPEIRVSLARARMATLRVTLRPASYYFLMQVAALVVMGTDNIVIGVFLGVSQVTAYAVAFQLWTVTLAILWTGVDALQPFFTRWDTTGDREKLREAYLRSTKVAFAGAVLAAIVIAAFGRQAIGVWVGRDLAVDRRVLWVFCGMLLTATPIHTASLVLAALGKHRPAAIGGVLEAALNLALSVALVRPFGVLGVALGTLLSGVVTNAWVAPLAAARALDIPVTTYVRRALLPAGLPALLGAALLGGR